MHQEREWRDSTDVLAYSVAQAARALQLPSADSVRRLVRKGVIPAKKLGRRWLIPVEALRQILTDAETR